MKETATTISNFEVMAPVGSRESLAAAIQAGADAVYLGGSRLNLRAFADNFTNEEIGEAAIRYAKLP